jgi:hypothetical protein
MKLQITNKIMAIPVVFAGIYLGIKPMLIGFIIVAGVYYLINVHFSARLIHYTMKEQLKDLLPMITVSGIVSILLYAVNFLEMRYWTTFIIQLVAGSILTVIIYNIIKFPEYINVQSKVLAFLHSKLR